MRQRQEIIYWEAANELLSKGTLCCQSEICISGTLIQLAFDKGKRFWYFQWWIGYSQPICPADRRKCSEMKKWHTELFQSSGLQILQSPTALLLPPLAPLHPSALTSPCDLPHFALKAEFVHVCTDLWHIVPVKLLWYFAPHISNYLPMSYSFS